MKKKLFILLAIVMFLIGTVCSVNATLFVRGTVNTSGAQQLIYDDVLDITWYDYTCGAQSWSNAMFWANSAILTFEGTVYDDWRLPTTPGTRPGYVNEGEMGHLYYDEGVTLSSSFPFLNIQDSLYWYGTEKIGAPTEAWQFYFGYGTQDTYPITRTHHAIAVRDGDVAAPVPEPCTMLLLGTGLIGMAGVMRRKIKR